MMIAELHYKLKRALLTVIDGDLMLFIKYDELKSKWQKWGEKNEK